MAQMSWDSARVPRARDRLSSFTQYKDDGGDANFLPAHDTRSRTHRDVTRDHMVADQSAGLSSFVSWRASLASHKLGGGWTGARTSRGSQYQTESPARVLAFPIRLCRLGRKRKDCSHVLSGSRRRTPMRAKVKQGPNNRKLHLILARASKPEHGNAGP